MIAESPQLALGVTRLVGLRRRRIERRLKYLLFHSNRDRIVNLLLELAEDYGVPGPNEIELKIKLSHQDLASIIGSTRESVTVILGKLQSEGLIRLGRRKIGIIDLQKLAALVETDPPKIAGIPPESPETTESSVSPQTEMPPESTVAGNITF